MAREKKIHYIPDESDEYGVCGTYGDEAEDYDNLITLTSAVTCANCLKWLAKNGEVTPAQKITFEVTDDLKAALKLVGKIGGAWADRTNQCRTYDEAIAHINSKLPEGAYIPSRLTTWLVKISNASGALTVKIVSKTKEEARQQVQNQARYFYEDNNGFGKYKIEVVGQVE